MAISRILCARAVGQVFNLPSQLAKLRHITRPGRSFIFQPQFCWESSLPTFAFLTKLELDGPPRFRFSRVRHYPEVCPGKVRGRTGCPPPVLSCTAWGFSCRT